MTESSSNPPFFEAINLGTGNGVTVRQILSASERVGGRPVPCVASPRRPGDPARLVASNRKAKRLLGWEPRRSDIHRILEDAWGWRLRHPNGYSD